MTLAARRDHVIDFAVKSLETARVALLAAPCRQHDDVTRLTPWGRQFPIGGRDAKARVRKNDRGA